MTIFDRIKQKANQALQGVGNFFDRDKSMDGVQIVPGGISGGINRVKQSFQQDPGQYSITRPISNVANNILDREVGGHQLRDQIKAYPEAFMQNLPFTPDRQENFNRNIEDILGQGSAPTTVAQGFNNWVGAPLAQVPYNVKEAFGGEEKSGLSRAGHGAQALFGLLPGVDDALFAGYNSLKGAATERSKEGFQPGLAGNEYFGLGDAVTGGNQDSLLTPALNMAELPLLLFGGLKAKNLDEVLQNQMKRVDDLSALKTANGADELVRPIKTAKDTIFVTPGGTAIKPRVQPRTTASLDEILSQADDVIPGGTKRSDDIGGLLTAGGQDVPQLPANIPDPLEQQFKQATKDISSTRVKERGILRKGYDYLMTQTPQRLERVFGKEFYNKHLDPVFTNLDKASKSADDFIDKRLTSIGEVVENSGIKPGSEDSKLLYTLRDEGLDAVINKVGVEKAEQIQNLFNAMRASYDEVYDLAAPIAAKLGKTLPKKENFLSQQGNKQLGINLDLTSGKTITDETSASLFKTQGDLQNVDPLEAFSLYMNKAANLIFMEPEAKYIEDLTKNISFNKNTNKDMLSQLEGLRTSITGEGQEFSTARKIFDKYFGQTKAAAVVGKGSTLINQVLGVPGAAANTGWRNFIMGNLDPATRKLVKEKSALFSSVDRGIPKSLQGTKIHQRIVQGMVDALQNANKFGYEVSLRGFVKQAENSGIDPKKIDDIVSQADKEAARVLGDRREWMTPEFYQTFTGKLLAPFTQEQTAQAASFLKNIGDKKAATVIKTLVGWKVGNDIWENVSGFRPFTDPIDMATDVAELWEGSDEKEKNRLKAFMRVAEEGLTLLPPVQSIVNQGYSVGDTLGILPDSRDVWANDRTWMSTGSLLNPLSNIKTRDSKGEFVWQPRNITGNKAVDTGLNIGAKYIPGVEQFNRTTQAVNSLNRGYAESRAGNPLFEMPDNPLEIGKALLFGQNSTKNAKEMFENDYDWGLFGDQKDIIDKIPSKQGKVDYLKSAREGNTADKRLESILDSGGSDIDSSLFDGKSAQSSSLKERDAVYKELNKVLSDDNIPQEAKDAFIKASGADPKEAQYYSTAAQDMDVKLQDEILPTIDGMNNEDMMTYLMQGRREVGDKQLVTSDMIEYLYDKNYISKNQKAALKALKYDQIKGEFYYDRDYKGGSSGSGGLTYKQALKSFKIDLPKFSKLKSMDLLLSGSIGGDASQTGREGEKLLSSILSSAPKQPGRDSGDRKLWF